MRKNKIIAIVLLAAGGLVLLAVALLWSGGGELREPAVSKEDAMAAAGERLEDPIDLATEQVPVGAARAEGDLPAVYRAALGAIVGRVVEPDGAPVAGIAVDVLSATGLDLLAGAAMVPAAEPEPLRSDVASTATQADGTFRVEGIHPLSLCALVVGRGGPRTACRCIDIVPGPGETADLGDIVLPASAAIAGVVRDQEGHPIARARVRAAALPADFLQSRFQDFGEGCLLLFDVTLFGHTLTVIEPPPALFRYLSYLAAPETFADEQGAFRIENAPAGRVTVIAQKSGFVTGGAEVETSASGGAADEVVIVLDRGMTISGALVDRRLQPVPGGEVRFAPCAGTEDWAIRVLRPPVLASGDGGFTFEGAPAAAFYVAARRCAGESWTVAGPFNPAWDQPVVKLLGGFDVRAAVERRPGIPAPEAWVRIRAKESFVCLNPGGFIDAHGRIEPVSEGVFLISNLAAGPYELQAGAPGFAVATEDVRVREDDNAVTIVLEPALAAEVRVLAKDTGEPVERAEVFIREKGQNSWIDSALRLKRARSRPSGAAVFDGLAAGAYEAAAVHPGFATGYATFEVSGGQPAAAVVRLEQGGVLEGAVLGGGGAPPPPYGVAMLFKGRNPFPVAATPRLTVTSDDGAFRIANLEPGAWRVEVRPRWLDLEIGRLLPELDEGPLAVTAAEIAAGATERVAIYLDPRSRGPCGGVGGIVNVNGAPAAEAVVSIAGEPAAKTPVDAFGRYAFGALPVGEHQIAVALAPAPGGSKAVTLRRNTTISEGIAAVEDFVIDTGTITGRVIRSSDGAPEAGVKVRVWIESDDPGLVRRLLNPAGERGTAGAWRAALAPVEMTAVTDLGGAFRAGGLPAGTYLVKAEKPGFGSRAAKDVSVPPGGIAGPVVLELMAPVALEGCVEIPAAARALRADAPKGAGGFLLLVKPRAAPGENAGAMLASMFNLGENIGGTKLISVGDQTGAFECGSMMPGAYTATFVVWLCASAEPIDVVIPAGGATSLLLRPVMKTGR